ncbi:hypothetical protein DAI22_08g198650 [Oryza sativa Japonica Group]|nr:hypothetical protein DAI22_08g198650 [Oryza sativa Japonica Group]
MAKQNFCGSEKKTGIANLKSALAGIGQSMTAIGLEPSPFSLPVRKLPMWNLARFEEESHSLP